MVMMINDGRETQVVNEGIWDFLGSEMEKERRMK